MPLMMGQKADGTEVPLPITAQGKLDTSASASGTFDLASDGPTGSTTPVDAILIGGDDGTNLRGARSFDLDTGAGADYNMGFSLRLPANGGSVAGGTVTNPLNVTGALTDTQLRASAVPVSGPVTDTQLRASAVPVSGPLTDTQLRATAVPVSGPLTDAALRATAVPVSLPLWPTVFSVALGSKLIVKASAGKMRSATVRIDSTAPSGTYYVDLWNLADVPTDTTAVSSGNSLMAPVKVKHVSGEDDYVALDFAEMGIAGSTGLVLGLSTSEFTQTAAGSYLSATAAVI